MITTVVPICCRRSRDPRCRARTSICLAVHTFSAPSCSLIKRSPGLMLARQIVCVAKAVALDEWKHHGHDLIIETAPDDGADYSSLVLSTPVPVQNGG